VSAESKSALAAPSKTSPGVMLPAAYFAATPMADTILRSFPHVSGRSRDCSESKSPDNCQGFAFKSGREQGSKNG
jgi:hypothetical protein